MNSHFDSVLSWLDHQCHVKAPADWLQACIEWIQSENEGQPFNCEHVKQLVYEQWLLSDLTEVGSSCLPAGINQDAKLQLTDHYCLQINSIVDVSVPYYGQLQKVEGTENENLHVTATQNTQAWSEPKSGRMLLLGLTDGTTDIRAMEHQSVPQLSVSTPPGSKIVVHGPVLCRLGVLMLRREQVELIGGEVDTLVESNTQKQLLKNCLENSQSHSGNGGVIHRWKGSGNYIKTSALQAKPLQARNTSQKPAPSTQWPNNEAGFDDDDDDILRSIDTEQLNQLDDEWDDGIDYTPIVIKPEPDGDNNDVMDCTTSAQPNKPSNRALQPIYSQHTVTNSGDNNRRSGNSLNSYAASATVSNSKRPRNAPFSNGSGLVGNRCMRTFLGSSDATKASKPSSLITPHIPSSGGTNSAVINIRAQLNSLCNQPIQSKQPSIRPSIPPEVSKVVKTMFAGSTISSDNPININIHSNGKKVSYTVPADYLINGDKDNATSNKFQTDVTQPVAKKSRQSTSTVTSLEMSQPNNAALANVLTGQSSAASRSSPDKWLSPPFTYITEFKSKPHSEPVTYTIKAYFATLLSKLEFNEGRHWSLRAKLNDGSASLDVNLSNELLSRLIGSTASHAADVKKGTITDKPTKIRLAMGLKRCQQYLVVVTTFMQIEVKGNGDLPCLTNFLSPKMDDIQLLKRRSAIN